MDPNTNLREQLSLAQYILDMADSEEGIPIDDAARLAELVLALNEWISRGGFLPTKWAK